MLLNLEMVPQELAALDHKAWRKVQRADRRMAAGTVGAEGQGNELGVVVQSTKAGAAAKGILVEGDVAGMQHADDVAAVEEGGFEDVDDAVDALLIVSHAAYV